LFEAHFFFSSSSLVVIVGRRQTTKLDVMHIWMLFYYFMCTPTKPLLFLRLLLVLFHFIFYVKDRTTGILHLYTLANPQ